MTTACRDQLAKVLVEHSDRLENPGLILERYLTASSKNDDANTARCELLEAAKSCSRGENIGDLYQHAFKRRLEWFDSHITTTQSKTTNTLHVAGKIVAGLGNPSPLETGLSLNHVYGLPLISGSSLKGLAAHFCDEVRGLADDRFRAPGRFGDGEDSLHAILFGTTGQAGFVTFHDAWIHPDCLKVTGECFVSDVMTPHHGDYYGKKEFTVEAKKGQPIPPSDFDDPNPVTFLSVSGRFHFALTCSDPSANGKAYLDLAMEILKEALEAWGVGGKTSSGYGRMTDKKIVVQCGPDPAEPTVTKYERGDKVTVTPFYKQNKEQDKNLRFRADDNLVGHIGHGSLPEINKSDDGKYLPVELYVVNKSGNGYTFAMTPPNGKKKSGGGKGKR